MRLFLGVVLGVALGVTATTLGPYGSARTALAKGTPSGNGDVNASGGIDVADAIYLLSYLFAHGPAPELIECAACDSCCPACPSSSLPATGQTACYNAAGSLVACDDANWPGQDGSYGAGCPTEERFVDNGDGTVTDNCTGLMWQQATAPGMYTWQNALKYCENLTLADYDDWRLPNVREAQSLIDYGRFAPSMDPVFIAMSSWYWSSSTDVNAPSLGWFVNGVEGHGSIGLDGKVNSHYVRAVGG